MGFTLIDMLNSIKDLTEASDLLSSVMPYAVDIDLLHLELIAAKRHVLDALEQIKWMKEYEFTKQKA